MKTTRLSALAAVALLLAGCGGDTDGQAEERPATSPMEPSDSASSAEAEEDPFAPNVGDRALSFGETRDGMSIDMTLEKVRYPYPPAAYREPFTPGNVYVGLRLEQCMTEDTPDAYSSYSGEWSVVTPGGQEYGGSGSSYDDFPTPKFPENVTLTTDRCLKGWIVTEVPEGTKIASIVYRPLGETVAEWLPPERGDGGASRTSAGLASSAERGDIG
ncbi:hypothetical protein GCM10009737_14460 [Nocardioides lentus]|uniref:Lipoprotein n=1 Tax=Nocardioides lentus TaxID=338077 RepID=A0ABN2P7B1_9ACTN